MKSLPVFIVLSLMMPWSLRADEAAAGAGAPAKESKEQTVARLNKLVLPTVSFNEVPLSECVGWLKGRGLAIELGPELAKKNPEPTVNLALKNVPAMEVVKSITKLTNTRFVVTKGKVTVREVKAGLFLKEWKVPPAFFEEGLPAANGPGQSQFATGYLKICGIPFPAGTFALYSEATKTLVVKQTEENLELVGELVAEFDERK
jgi:hypothetical protein